MDVIIMYSCSFPLNGVMVVLVFARFFLRIYRLLYRRQCWVLKGSCSGFKEDFHDEIAYGEFGYVNTADGKAKIDGFGFVKWDTVSQDGETLTIWVPAYYSSAVPMRLLSPQDYCRYYDLPTDETQYRGTSS